MYHSREQLETGRLVWLLEITIRGKSYRFSTDIIEVLSGDTTDGPASFHFAAGLEFLEYEDTIGILQAESSERTVSVSVTFQGDQREGWSSLTDTSRDAGQATGELSLLIVGDTYKDRRVVVSGFIDSATYGGQNEPVEFSITQSDYLDPITFPSESMQVTADTWPEFTNSGAGDWGQLAPYAITHKIAPDDTALGQFYPIVFGQPGTHPPRGWSGWNPKVASTADPVLFDATPGLIAYIDHTTGNTSSSVFPGDDGGTPADPSDDIASTGQRSYRAVCVIAGHECADVESSVSGITAGEVVMYSDGWRTGGSNPVYIGYDALGQTVSYVNIDEGSLPNESGYIELGAEVWVAWDGKAGVLNEDRSGPLLGAGEIIEYLLEQSGLKVDTFASRQPLREVDEFVLDFWINEPRTAWATISEDILPLLPMSSYASERGVGFVYWNWDAKIQDAVAEIDIQREIGERIGPVEVSSINEIYNNMTINYCRTGPDGVLRKSMTYTHDDYNTGLGTTFNPYSWASFTRYGVREGPSIEAPVVERDETAAAILDWMIRYYSQTRRTVTYQLGQKYQALELGNVVTITDSEIGFSDHVCLVSGIIRAPGLTEVTFTTCPHWAIDPKV